jgi:hypothetical protein
MVDGTKTVMVHISTSTLRQRAEVDQQKTENVVLLYSAYREEIEAAASIKYDQGHCGSADIVVIASDLA